MLAALVAALALAACCEDDFENNPRPPAPVELTARVGDNSISLGPDSVGAGLANITVSNQTPDPVRLVFEGPTEESSDEIVAGGTGSLQHALEVGEYSVSDGEGEREARLTVGPERESSQNDLLLP